MVTKGNKKSSLISRHLKKKQTYYPQFPGILGVSPPQTVCTVVFSTENNLYVNGPVQLKLCYSRTSFVYKGVKGV